MQLQRIGLVGCGVMGQNLALNLERHGYSVAVFDSDSAKLSDYLQGSAAGHNIVGVSSLAELAAAVDRPRRILIMVPAGQAVDACIRQALPHLEQGDILIDGGNSHYRDTDRRVSESHVRGLRYVGAGISGGEQGSLHGPAIMPGGTPSAWDEVKEVLRAIAARAEDGRPCCDWIGPGGAGHFVKMVHNGIEYGEMQLLCEAYHLMRDGLGMSPEDMGATFDTWNRGRLRGYLVEITARIVAFRDQAGGIVVDDILDVAGQKGTGKWAAAAALELGQPLTLTGEAVFARFVSTLRDERLAMADVQSGPAGRFAGDREGTLEDLCQALYAGRIVCYAQGFQLMRAAGREHRWDLDHGSIASLWRGGCIIRAAVLQDIRAAFERNPGLPNLLLDPNIADSIQRVQQGWRRAVVTAVNLGIPVPAVSSALAYFDGYRNPRLPANLLQAQRDCFGAHTYERIDQPRGRRFHTEWI